MFLCSNDTNKLIHYDLMNVINTVQIVFQINNAEDDDEEDNAD